MSRPANPPGPCTPGDPCTPDTWCPDHQRFSPLYEPAQEQVRGALGGGPRMEVSLGELKRAWRESHLCLQCAHHAVCQVSRSIDPDLLQAVSSCLAYAQEA